MVGECHEMDPSHRPSVEVNGPSALLSWAARVRSPAMPCSQRSRVGIGVGTGIGLSFASFFPRSVSNPFSLPEKTKRRETPNIMESYGIIDKETTYFVVLAFSVVL